MARAEQVRYKKEVFEVQGDETSSQEIKGRKS